MKKALLSFILATFCLVANAQQTTLDPREWSLRDEQDRKERIEKYRGTHNIPLRYSDGGRAFYLYDVQFDQPVYITTHNEQAATMIRARDIQQGGSLGLDLDGSGVQMAIWEVGKSINHDEFTNRIRLKNGPATDSESDSDHATFVAGQFISEGLNPSVKGVTYGGILDTYDISNEVAEITDAASLLLTSNHSYGLRLGWTFSSGSWNWDGVASISEVEDYRFGLYTSLSRTLDQIAVTNPNYLMVWSAGNDRNDTGDGTRPPDGNGGTGFDTIGPRAVTKNSLAVGAVLKSSGNSASDINMSTFSAWGPTDDGRIKPDLVAPGVSILSTGSDSPTHYYTSQGTSFASPLVSAGAALLQEHYKETHTDEVMTAATVKALLIHTATEAGNNTGPDYRFGWGLINLEKAVEQMGKGEDEGMMLEETLTQGSTFTYEIFPSRGSMIKASIAWTDPAGTPAGNVLDPTNRMLINDLDLRIVDEGGNEIQPWKLNPASPTAAATRGDNNRDNVEQVYLVSAEPRKYTVIVRHKGSLQGGAQNFSIVMEYDQVVPESDALYWVGGNGSWQSGSNWSLTSGGSASGQTPQPDTRVIFDENSFNAANQTVQINGNTTVESIQWFSDINATIAGNGNTVTLNTDFYSNQSTLRIQSLRLGLSAGTSSVSLGSSDANGLTLVSNASDVSVQNIDRITGIELESGTLRINNGGQQVRMSNLRKNGDASATLNIANQKISQLRNLQISGTGSTIAANGSELSFNSNAAHTIDLGENTFAGRIRVIQGTASFTNVSEVGIMEVRGNVVWNDPNASVLVMESFGGSNFDIPAGVLELTPNWTVSETGQAINISSSNQATIQIDDYSKICLDNVSIENINLAGDAVVSLGTNGSITNGDNWFALACDEIPFADFTFEYDCEGGLTNFINTSTGNIDSYLWDFAGQLQVTDENPRISFNTLGNVPVTLTARSGNQDVVYATEISIRSNPLAENDIIKDGIRFVSRELSDTYEWYRDGILIEGENERIYETEEFGIYTVVTFDENCNRLSSPFAVVSVEDEIVSPSDEDFTIYPNPATESVRFTGFSGFDKATLRVISLSGKVLVEETVDDLGSFELDIRELPQGMLIFEVVTDKGIVNKRIIKR